MWTQESCEADELAHSIIGSTSHFLALSMTQYQVYTSISGFGRLGSLLSGQWDSMFGIEPEQSRSCHPRDADSLAMISAQGAGV